MFYTLRTPKSWHGIKSKKAHYDTKIQYRHTKWSGHKSIVFVILGLGVHVYWGPKKK